MNQFSRDSLEIQIASAHNHARVDKCQRKFFNYYNCNLPNPRKFVTFAININTKTVRKPQNTLDNVLIHNFVQIRIQS